MQKIKGLALLSLLTLSLIPALARSQDNFTLSQTAADALVAVVAHEMGHAVLREFDLPILGPEEAIADDFAVILVHMVLPDRAADIVRAKALQDLADGAQIEGFSEYIDDDQRAARAVCLLYGIEPDTYEDFIAEFMDLDLIERDDLSDCRNFATEVFRSWRRILDGYWMPEGVRISEVGIALGDSPLISALRDTSAPEEAYQLLSSIDWHSQIRLEILHCSGGALWIRTEKRIEICDSRIAKFERQLGEGASASSGDAGEPVFTDEYRQAFDEVMSQGNPYPGPDDICRTVPEATPLTIICPTHEPAAIEHRLEEGGEILSEQDGFTLIQMSTN